MSKFRAVGILLMICFVLAGCGQKGPLYLPGQTQQSGEQSRAASQ